MKELVAVQDLTIVVYGRTVFDRFSLRACAGEVVVLVGANGSGKSTLLDVVAGVRPPLRGRVVIGGVDAARDRQRAARGFGYAADRPALPQAIRVDEWLALVCAIRGVARSSASTFDVDDLRGQPLGTLSLGETRRVLLASAFAGAPPLLLLDEPTNGLDRHRRGELERRIADHAAGGGAVVVATHDRGFAAGMLRSSSARRIELGSTERTSLGQKPPARPSISPKEGIDESRR